MRIAEILSRKFPNEEWALNGDDYAGLIWLSDSEKPTEEELLELWPSVEALLFEEEAERINARNSILERLGLTENEAKLILG